MITTEEVLSSLLKEVKINRKPDAVGGRFLSKDEMKDILVYILNLKNQNKYLQSKIVEAKDLAKSIVAEIRSLEEEADENE